MAMKEKSKKKKEFNGYRKLMLIASFQKLVAKDTEKYLVSNGDIFEILGLLCSSFCLSRCVEDDNLLKHIERMMNSILQGLPDYALQEIERQGIKIVPDEKDTRH